MEYQTHGNARNLGHELGTHMGLIYLLGWLIKKTRGEKSRTWVVVVTKKQLAVDIVTQYYFTYSIAADQYIIFCVSSYSDPFLHFSSRKNALQYFVVFVCSSA